MPNARNIDPHLLTCLEVLVEERHVTRAAERMNMTQSGMSNALARLRILFGDPILVRTSHGMEPTARAITLARRIGHVLTRSEEHTSELQSLMRISYAAFCLKKNIHNNIRTYTCDLSSNVR